MRQEGGSVRLRETRVHRYAINFVRYANMKKISRKPGEHVKHVFIAIYGINNIGKSWHAKRLVERLKAAGKKAIYIKYPAYEMEPSGSVLNTMLRKNKVQNVSEEELQLWYTLNRFQHAPILKKLLEEHDYVVTEDYTGTGICWGYTKGANLEWLEKINAPLIPADLSVLMTGERKKASAEKEHLHESNEELLTKAEKNFLILADRYHWKSVLKDEDYEITNQRFWDILVAADSTLR